ncbi:MAG: LytR C-terminal domain-containing protein [Actinomycetota bacterium]|nr:LytR C-terminal domain-containing protein [Actinomycetota bacterium]
MNDNRRSRDMWKQSQPGGSDGEAARSDVDETAPQDESAAGAENEHYSPRHRAPGRASLIRRRRTQTGSTEEVAWETLYRKEESATTWTTEEQPSATQPPQAIEDLSYLGPTRAELKKRRTKSLAESPPEEPQLGSEESPSAGSTREPERRDLYQAADTMVEGDIELASDRSEAAVETGPGRVVGPAPGAASSRTSRPQESSRARPTAPPVPTSPAWASATVPGHDEQVGPRRTALEQRKKRQRMRKTAGVVAATIAAVGGVGAAGFMVTNAVDPPKEKRSTSFAPPQQENSVLSTLFFGTKESSSGARGATWMTLVTLDPASDKASVVYIPSHTAVEVPGRGLQGVGEAYGSGGVPLLLVSAENLLGVNIDRYVELSDNDALVLFEALGSLTVDVPAEVRVPVGRDQARLIFVEGPQQLSPSLLVKLLYIVGIDGDDVELGSRHLAFWGQLLEEYDDPGELASAVREAGAALGESDATPEEHAEFLSALADVAPEDVTLTTLPVRPISAGDSELYATDAEELATFVDETIGLDRDASREVRVQVLNGNGVPGIGQDVASELVGEGFRVILSGNARRLNYRKTLVITYDESDEGVALAERARDLLGVGEVQVSAQQQGIVDLTIVVGKDFLRAR